MISPANLVGHGGATPEGQAEAARLLSLGVLTPINKVAVIVVDDNEESSPARVDDSDLAISPYGWQFIDAVMPGRGWARHRAT